MQPASDVSSRSASRQLSIVRPCASMTFSANLASSAPLGTITSEPM
jgi:hypothetical protein